MRADVAVIGAVWHRQQDKESLLAGHHRNLEGAHAARVVYVFDGGDRPPEWLEGPEEIKLPNFGPSPAADRAWEAVAGNAEHRWLLVTGRSTAHGSRFPAPG